MRFSALFVLVLVTGCAETSFDEIVQVPETEVEAFNARLICPVDQPIKIRKDRDGDTWGHGVAVCAMSVLPGYVRAGSYGDCDDRDPTVNPGADEVCDGVADNDCDDIPDARELDGSYDANGDGDFVDFALGEFSEYGGPDGFTNCYPYAAQIDFDGDGYCQTGFDANGDGDCQDTETGDVLYPNDGTSPSEYEDCALSNPAVYPGHGC